jgi:hypothetical protein
MYFVTGFLIVRYDWFKHVEPDIIIIKKQVSINSNEEIENIVGSIRQQLKVKGKFNNYEIRQDGSIELRFIKPDLETLVNIFPEKETARIEQKKQDVFGIITVFHRLHQYGGGLKYDIFMFMMDLASISLILFSLSGIYLWFKILQNRIWGVISLILGLSYTIWVIFTLII